jgi:lipopolysaccharide cholinephosphotransferase
MDNVKNSLNLLNIFFNKHNVEFWLEAGTALSAHRDGKVFPWEHDIDVAIWRDEMPNPEFFLEYFRNKGYDVVLQKDFPFIDNIIQLRASKKLQSNLFDVDIYLYTRKEGHAYMRWIQKPEGKYSYLKKKILFILKNLLSPRIMKWKILSSLVPKKFLKFLHSGFLKFHIDSSTCIYHRFPEEFFLNLKKIDFYGISINIPSKTDDFLTHRYGSNWSIPDSQFNQSGKWKQSNARVELDMNLLAIPDYYEQKAYKK